MEELVVPGLYKHFKGQKYVTVGIATSIPGIPKDLKIHRTVAIHTEHQRRISIWDMCGELRFYGEKEDEPLVVYVCITGKNVGKMYARPIQMFMSEVDREKYPTVEQNSRFEKLEDEIYGI